MLQKMTRTNEKGFTLIELMIVIAIIGILAAIAIPNFIAYRNKAFCSAAENDANSIAAALADYFAIPSHTGLPGTPALLSVKMSGPAGSVNTATITGNPNITISIIVTDVSTRCPTDYQAANTEWAAGVYTKILGL
jgi:prepilin-type N-terminal cleavage/methylation domain-containing protein